VGGTVGDDGENVAENRRRSFAALGRPPDSLFDVWQVHGNQVARADAPRPLHQPHQPADAIITDRPGLSLFMRFADCVPIFLYDPLHRAIGLAHAGWQGTLKRTAAAAVQAMQAQYGSRPAELLACIGPSIGAHHYPVGPEVVRQARQAFGAEAAEFLRSSNGSGADSTVQFDLWSANRLVLTGVGVRQIEVCELCTACDLENWYSHRAEKGETGRFGALIAI
jgi:hypothetical protein